MKRTILLCLLLINSSVLFAKEPDDNTPLSNFSLLKEKKVDERTHVHQHSIRFMRSRTNNVLLKYNPVSLLFGGMMYVYQGIISPQLPSECLYVETCSHYSQHLISEYGLFKGIFTTSDRLMRCNRLSALDVHPMMVDEKNGKVVESVDIYKLQD